MWHLTLHRWIGDPQDAIEEKLDEHLAWMRTQQLDGTVVAGGPSSDGNLGIIVFGHSSRDDVDELLRHEPFISAGLRQCEVIDWEVHHLLGIGGFDRKTITAMFGPPRSASNASSEG